MHYSFFSETVSQRCCVLTETVTQRVLCLCRNSLPSGTLFALLSLLKQSPKGHLLHLCRNSLPKATVTLLKQITPKIRSIIGRESERDKQAGDAERNVLCRAVSSQSINQGPDSDHSPSPIPASSHRERAWWSNSKSDWYTRRAASLSTSTALGPHVHVYSEPISIIRIPPVRGDGSASQSATFRFFLLSNQ